MREIQVRYSAYLSVCRADEETLNKYKSVLEGKKEQLSEFWYSFGFLYFGLISHTYSKVAYERTKSSKWYAKSIYAKKLVELVFNNEIDENKEIVSKIQSGMKEAAECFELNGINLEEATFSGLEYLAEKASEYDKRQIMEALCKVNIMGNEELFPITLNEKIRFGVVYPWPGVNCAETELMERMLVAADNIGFDCILLSDFGKVLDEKCRETDEIVDESTLDFIFTTHYESHKAVDTYYYHLLWNPPEIPLNVEYYAGRVINNYIMNDDYLIYDFGGMKNHLKSILLNKPRNIDNASTFVGSFPKSIIMEPNLENPMLFYCGMNWEKVVSNSNRHSGLFQLLDETKKIRFYGPEVVKEWGGIRPWAGYDCYQYSIPFDGFSVLNEINKCGICLAISSDAHRRAGAVTNRAYEACAAGAVIISDNNIFMEEYFKDSVLYVTYNKDEPQDTCNQIMRHYDWICTHKEEAVKMAKRAQQIFVERFCMEINLLEVTKNHRRRFQTIEKDLFAKTEKKTVLVSYVLNTINANEIKDKLLQVVKNVSHQYYRNIVLAIACNDSITNEVSEICKELPCYVEVVGMQMFDDKKSRSMTDGQAREKIKEVIPYDYHIQTSNNEIWFYDHVATLIRTIEEDVNCAIAYSGVLAQDKEKIRREFMFKSLDAATVYYNEHPNCLPIGGQFMFTREAEEKIPKFLNNCLDGYEYLASIALLWFRYNEKLLFSKRMTCVWKNEQKIEAEQVLDKKRQINFIRGLVKYDIPSGGLCNSDRRVTTLSKLTLSIPMVVWFKLKMYLVFILPRVKQDSNFGKKINQKYNKLFNRYANEVDRIQ